MFLSQISLRLEAINLAPRLSCLVVWLAKRVHEYLSLFPEPEIRGIIFRATDLSGIAALRERRRWIQPQKNRKMIIAIGTVPADETHQFKNYLLCSA